MGTNEVNSKLRELAERQLAIHNELADLAPAVLSDDVQKLAPPGAEEDQSVRYWRQMLDAVENAWCCVYDAPDTLEWLGGQVASDVSAASEVG